MIKADHITKKFDTFVAVNDISVTIESGCIYGLVGSNGAGKSTLLRIITGIYKPNKGTVLYDGRAVWDCAAVKSQFAYVPDELFFLPGANINRMAKLYQSIYPNFSLGKVIELTDTLELSRTQKIHTFSKGMKRQAATILALATGAQYLFFDETFDGLDPVIRNFFKKIICDEVEVNHTTAVITSHSLRELEDICDQLALLHKGGLVLQSDIEQLKTAQCKIQIAFSEEYTKELFKDIEIVTFQKRGLVSNMIVKGDKDEIVKSLQSLSPILLEVLPLSLEETFTYEMETLGYHYNVD